MIQKKLLKKPALFSKVLCPPIEQGMISYEPFGLHQSPFLDELLKNVKLD